MGDKVAVSESPWLLNLLVVFNTKKPPFDDVRVRRALSLAIDRWGAAEQLQDKTFLKFVGGVMRPGYAMATSESSLATLPGFAKDIAASRAEAQKLLKEAGASDLKFTLVNRTIPMPYGPGADYLIEAWKKIGVTVTQTKLGTREWQTALEQGEFEVGIDFGGDFFDDPSLQLAKFVSSDLSPANYARSNDSFLDALYIGQAITTDRAKRAEIVREFEKRAMTEAYTVPFLWWNRIIANSSRLKGWSTTPSHYIHQDLVDAWLEPR